MTNDANHSPQGLPSESTGSWQVAPVRTETVEVTTSGVPQVKYILEATKSLLKVEVFENDELVEKNRVERAVHEIIVEAFEGSSSHMRVAMSPTKDTMVTHVLLKNEEFQVESTAGEHALVLYQELKKRQFPTHPRLQLLAQELQRNQTLLNEITRHTSYGRSVLYREGESNGIKAACVAACFLCSLGNFAFCVACAICIDSPENPPPITLKPISESVNELPAQ